MKAIDLQPLGDAEPDVLASLRSGLSETFSVPVRVCDRSLSIDAFYDEGRGQYNSTAILNRISRSLPFSPDSGSENNVSIVGVAQEDLFIPILTYVFGEAALGGNVAVVSYHRFRNELYGLPANKELMLERLRKVAVHELGHTLGLVHCTLQSCVMRAASYVEELDFKGREFCPSCLRAVAGRIPSRR